MRRGRAPLRRDERPGQQGPRESIGYQQRCLDQVFRRGVHQDLQVGLYGTRRRRRPLDEEHIHRLIGEARPWIVIEAGHAVRSENDVVALDLENLS